MVQCEGIVSLAMPCFPAFPALNIALMHPKDADGMANSLDPDQTASSEAV